MPITRSTDGDWNLQLTILHFNGYQEHKTKLLTTSPDLSHYQMIARPQSWCSQPPIQMDQHSTQEAKHHTNTKQPWTQSLQALNPSRNLLHPDLMTVKTNQDITLKPLTANRHEALLQMQRTDPFCKVCQNGYQMAMHHSMRLIYLHTLKDYYTNMPWIQIRNFWHSSYPKLGNIQY